ncbi:hypothetical protein IT401_02315 [Candidatus Nomurabacteria bacterium]|nr:hypothetical protein [Candidatus Nomurabacteria bacterium]
MSYDEDQNNNEEFTETEMPELLEDETTEELDLKDEPDQYTDDEEGEDDYMSAIMNPNGEQEYSM